MSETADRTQASTEKTTTEKTEVVATPVTTDATQAKQPVEVEEKEGDR
ncbi:MAG: hypothetical protein ACJ74Y_14440 [Bryobacteraceae bacterium]|jgi:hypothetical protein